MSVNMCVMLAPPFSSVPFVPWWSTASSAISERMVALSEERIELPEREIERRGEAEERLHRIVAGLTQTAAQLSVRVPELEAPRMPPIKSRLTEPADPKRAGPDREDPKRAQPESVEPERPLAAEPLPGWLLAGGRSSAIPFDDAGGSGAAERTSDGSRRS